jgi:hypothetical protein
MSTEGQIILLLVGVAVGAVATPVLTVVLLVRQPPDQEGYWRTVRRHLTLSAALCCGLPLLLLFLRLGVSLFAVATPVLAAYWWTLPLTLAFTALGFGAWWLWKRERAPEDPEPLEAPQIDAEPVPMWSAPLQRDDPVR